MLREPAIPPVAVAHMSASLFVRGRARGVSNPPQAVTRLLHGRHHLERVRDGQAAEMDYLITWRDNEFVGRVSVTPFRVGANRRCLAFPKSPSCLLAVLTPFCPHEVGESVRRPHRLTSELLGEHRELGAARHVLHDPTRRRPPWSRPSGRRAGCLHKRPWRPPPDRLSESPAARPQRGRALPRPPAPEAPRARCTMPLPPSPRPAPRSPSAACPDYVEAPMG